MHTANLLSSSLSPSVHLSTPTRSFYKRRPQYTVPISKVDLEEHLSTFRHQFRELPLDYDTHYTSKHNPLLFVYPGYSGGIRHYGTPPYISEATFIAQQNFQRGPPNIRTILPLLSDWGGGGSPMDGYLRRSLRPYPCVETLTGRPNVHPYFPRLVFWCLHVG